MRRLIVITCLVGSFLLVGFVGGGEASTTQAHAAAVRVRLQVLRGFQGQVLTRARVRIHGRSFWFLIDTGAAVTLVNPAVARELHLKTVGRPTKVTGVGCSETARNVRLSNWSIGGHPLPKVVGTSSILTDSRLAVGLLGSDVLSRFGAAGIDYAHQVLTLG